MAKQSAHKSYLEYAVAQAQNPNAFRLQNKSIDSRAQKTENSGYCIVKLYIGKEVNDGKQY
jgi:hypothetical protein